MIRRAKEMRPEVALIRLEELCSRSEQCEWELRKKLKTWRIAPDDADTIIRSLARRRYVDDSRYAMAFTRDKYRFARWGRRKIEMTLRLRHIDPDIIDEALDSIDQEEYEASLRHILANRIKTHGVPADYEERMKLFRFALARGFESDLIRRTLASLTSDAEGTEDDD